MGHLLHQPHPWCVGRTGRSVCIVNGAENGFQMGFVWGAGELVEKFKACTRMHFWLSVRFCTAEQNEIHEMDLFAPCVCFRGSSVGEIAYNHHHYHHRHHQRLASFHAVWLGNVGLSGQTCALSLFADRTN